MKVTEEIRDKAAERAVRAAAKLISRSAFDLLYMDPHFWSEKPCATCRILTGMMGFEVGCDKYRHEKAQQQR